MSDNLHDLFGEVIHTYTRRQAIEDGVLVDLCGDDQDAWMPAMVREAGFKIPVAMTTTAFVDCVCPIEGDGMQLAPCQDIKGRLWDVLLMLLCAIRSGSQDRSTVHYQLYVVPNIPIGSKRNPRAKVVTLKAVIGPDDDGRPCITIIYPHED